MSEATDALSTFLNNLLAAAQAGQANDILSRNANTKSAQVAIPASYQVIDTEAYENNPNLFRGTFHTAALADFLAYVSENFDADDATAVFIDSLQRQLTATAIIDLGKHKAPEWARHRCELDMALTPAYEAVLTNHEKKHSQRYFIEFAEDYIEHIVFYDADGNAIDRNKAMTALRKLTLETVNRLNTEVADTKFSASAFESMEMKSQTANLPVKFSFECAPYEGLSNAILHCNLRPVLESHDKTPVLKYRIVNLNAVTQAAAQEFRAAVETGLPEGARVFVGRMEV